MQWQKGWAREQMSDRELEQTQSKAINENFVNLFL